MRRARISTAAISDNVRELRRRIPDTTIIAVVKANAYGHGAVESARAALDGGATWLGVADLCEALELREAGIQEPVLFWIHAPGTDFGVAIERGIDVGVNSRAQLDAVTEAARRVGSPAIVQLKCDSGLSRNGIPTAERAEVFARARAYETEGLLRVRGVFSHLSNASEADDRAAVELFMDILAEARAAGLTPELTHIAASAAALSYPGLPVNAVRLGLLLYGLSPLPGQTSADLGLRPAMRLEGTVLHVRRLPAGTGLSYDYTYHTAAETTVVLVGLGYADGIPRAASSVAPVSINGRTYRVSGRVAMDQFIVDVGDDTVQVGDTAVLWGDPADGIPSVEEFASACGTINYEMVTRVGPRVTRVYAS
ncbi:alanine racemase [Klugiella xanthotipulae]|nr:alanine racemase [Klugiella xanthotipulae]